MIDWIVEPWGQGAWMARGVAAGALSAAAAAGVGSILYLRRLSLIADALTHVALPGIVFAFLLTGSTAPWVMVAGALVAGAASTLAIEALARRPRVRADAAIGIVFTGAFAAGVIALSRYVRDAHIDLECVLYGDLLGISDESLWLLAFVCPLSLGALIVFWRWLVASSFDEAFARAGQIPVRAVHYGLMLLTTLVAVASFEAVGSVLSVALLIVPAASAHWWTRRAPWLVALSIAGAVLCSIVGMYAAVIADLSAAGATVCALGAWYFVSAARGVAAGRHVARDI